MPAASWVSDSRFIESWARASAARRSLCSDASSVTSRTTASAKYSSIRVTLRSKWRTPPPAADASNLILPTFRPRKISPSVLRKLSTGPCPNTAASGTSPGVKPGMGSAASGCLVIATTLPTGSKIASASGRHAMSAWWRASAWAMETVRAEMVSSIRLTDTARSANSSFPLHSSRGQSTSELRRPSSETSLVILESGFKSTRL